MPATAMIHVRVDETVKQQATVALAKMGLTVSGAVNLFLTRVAADQAIPFPVQVPNAATREAMAEASAIAAARQARFSDPDRLIDVLEAPTE